MLQTFGAQNALSRLQINRIGAVSQMVNKGEIRPIFMVCNAEQ